MKPTSEQLVWMYQTMVMIREFEETLAKVSEREIENALGRLQDSLLRLEQDFGESGRAATSKWLAELDAKSTDTTHTAFESLFKTCGIDGGGMGCSRPEFTPSKLAK